MNAALVMSAMMALMPAQGSASLGISNVRLTYGELGSVRPNNQYLQADVVYISFDVEGLKMTPEGKVVYSMGMDVLDKAGKAVFAQPPTKDEKLLPLGGGRLPAFVYLAPGKELQPGTYTCKVTFIDETAKATKTLEQKFEVLPQGFGVVQMFFSKDDRGLFACGQNGIVGQTLYVNFGMVGFGRNAQGRPDAAVEFRVLDSSGQPTNSQPIVMPVPPQFPANEPFVPFQVMMPLNRTGNFTVEVKATDKISGKSTSLSFPVNVSPAAK